MNVPHSVAGAPNKSAVCDGRWATAVETEEAPPPTGPNPAAGFAINANYISLYACGADERGFVAERYKAKLPKAKIGKSCVRFKKLADLDLKALEALLKETAKMEFNPG